MASRNDITGDQIKSKVGGQDAYATGWDLIFGKKNIVRDIVENSEPLGEEFQKVLDDNRYELYERD
jgi:hypothetical protein